MSERYLEIINPSETIKGFDGKEFFSTNQTTKERTALTWKQVCVEALLNVQKDQEIPAEEKYKRFAIAQAIHASEASCMLSVSHAKDVMSQVGKLYGPLIVGRVFEKIHLAQQNATQKNTN